MFGRMIRYLQEDTQRVHIRETNGRQSFAFDRVATVSEAVAILQHILSLEP